MVIAITQPVEAQHPGDTTKTFFTRRDIVYSAAALAGTGVLSIFDKRIAHFTQTSSIQGSSTRHDVVNDLTHVNETTLTEASIVAYAVGRLSHSNTIADVAVHTGESVVLTSVISQIIRGPLGRTRPSVSPDDQYHFQFGKGFTHFDNRSFPSLHSATAFAAATAIVGEIHERDPNASWFVAPALYAGAAIPGLTRMYLDQHWASDVVSGAFVGILLGSRVVHYAHTHKRNKLDRFLLGTKVAPTANGAVVGFSFKP
jgi:membrane-associated phospholipid phosphatase